MTESISFYPGSFDPITNGHADIVARALKLFDRLIVGVASSRNKNTLFSLKERIELVKEVVEKTFTQQKQKIVVVGFDTLLIESMREHKAKVVLRGMRAVSDFEFEFQLASMNRALEPQLETVFLTASEKYHFLSSRFVREIALMGGDVSTFVHPAITKALAKKARVQNSSK